MDQEKPARARRSKARADQPTTPDAVEIAMEAQASGKTPQGPALNLIERQTALIDADLRHRGWQIANERASMGLRLLTGLAGLAVAVLVVVMIVAAAQSQAVVVEPFGAPPELVERGYSGQVLAASLQDELQRIQTATRTQAAQRNIANAWSGAINVEAPYTGVSIGEIEKVLRQRLGHDTRISGDLTQTADGGLSLTVRGDGIAPMTFTGTADQLPALVKQAAEHAYGEAEPALFAHYLYQQSRMEDSQAVIRKNLTRGVEGDDRASLYNTWGNLMWAEERYLDAITRYEAALEITPYRWGAWRNLAGIMSECCGDEAAIAYSRRMLAAMEAAPSDKRPTRDYLDVEYGLRGDYSTAVATLREEDRKVAGGFLFATTAPRLAVLEMSRHDWKAAREALATGDMPEAEMQAYLRGIDGVEAREAGRAEGAIEAFEQLTAIPLSGDRGYADSFYCDLALAYATNDRKAAALQALSQAADTTACRALTGAIHEALGDRAAADVAARRSIGAAPSSPFPYEARGRVLLGRGDLNGAAWRFDQAHARGPRWADPIKGQGDVLAARGRWREAAAKYREALAFAPGWIDLRQALARAERGGR